jgi:hypothetical protein
LFSFRAGFFPARVRFDRSAFGLPGTLPGQTLKTSERQRHYPADLELPGSPGKPSGSTLLFAADFITRGFEILQAEMLNEAERAFGLCECPAPHPGTAERQCEESERSD